MWNETEYQRKYQRQQRAERKAKGLCITCGKTATKGTRCDECSKGNVASKKKAQEERQAAGLCKRCGKCKPLEGILFCEECKTKTAGWQKAARERREKEGNCTVCGKPANGKKCELCRKKSNAQTQAIKDKRMEAGLCRDCGKEAQMIDREGQFHMPGGKRNSHYCRECFFKMMAGYILGSRKFWPLLLEKLEKADWRCAYTGEKLILGENLSFDHVKPICRFPELKHDPENVEPVTLTINLMKRHMTKEEFLALVHLIARHKVAEE